MPEFAYKALTRDGRSCGGAVSAASRSAAVNLLAERGEFVVELGEGSAAARDNGALETAPIRPTPAARFTLSARVSARQRAALLRQVSVALSAGLTLVAALRVVAEQAETPAQRELIDELTEAVQRGESLSDAMRSANDGKAFNTMQVSMVRAGEAAGVLDEVMMSLADFAERDVAIREKLRSAAIYPAMVLALAFVSIIVILVWVLPTIMESLADTGGDLPLPTVILMQMSEALRSPAGIAAGVLLFAGLLAFWKWRQSDAGRLWLDGLTLKLPVLGSAARRVATARFARVLGTLTGAGIPVVEALRIVRDTLGNEVLGRRVDAATADIVRGRPVAESLGGDDSFPPLLVQVVAMGERTGKLDELLLRSADTYDRETEAALQRVMSVVPALLIVGLACVVAFILAAALLPIVGMDLGG